MWCTSAHPQVGGYAVHQVRDGWEIIAPSDDPTTPAYWRVVSSASMVGAHGRWLPVVCTLVPDALVRSATRIAG